MSTLVIVCTYVFEPHWFVKEPFQNCTHFERSTGTVVVLRIKKEIKHAARLNTLRGDIA
jgi:hypothetical protein